MKWSVSIRYFAKYETFPEKKMTRFKCLLAKPRCYSKHVYSHVSFSVQRQSASSQSLSMKKTSLLSGSGEDWEDWDALMEGDPTEVS